jgi:anti-sigma regulatory factor (Ser/Thr protein kinase)
MDIKGEILELASKKVKLKSSDVLAHLNNSVSRQYVNLMIRDLVKDGLLIKGGQTAGSFYVLPSNAHIMSNITRFKLKREDLEEHKVFNNLREKAPIMKNLTDNISSILFYAFTEMLNNAIEHSQSKYVQIELQENQGNISFTVDDFGIGAFRNVMQHYHLKNELEAIQELLKGKVTTLHSHTGQGIFFTSKISDLFVLDSYGYRLRVDNAINDVFIEELNPIKRGTKVTFTISLKTNKHLNDVFNEYATAEGDYAFDKTKILVKLFTSGTIYISRSQARRILTGLDKYKTVVMDFDKVKTVGQAFADEIFRVFKERHPTITIQPINMIEPVKFMIDRVEKP